jgi:hypothetical protein
MINLIVYILAILWISERVGKWIPDDADGVLGGIRKASKTISLYTMNKAE